MSSQHNLHPPKIPDDHTPPRNQHSPRTPLVPTRCPGNTSHFMPLATIKRGQQDKENKTTLHMTTSTRQQSSLSPMDLSASHSRFATWARLCDDDYITARISSTTAAMVALKETWHNPHLGIYNKYMLLRAIPMNLLLWGAETWSLRKSQLDQLEVFLHCSI